MTNNRYNEAKIQTRIQSMLFQAEREGERERMEFNNANLKLT